jgi:hypothetical protein
VAVGIALDQRGPFGQVEGLRPLGELDVQPATS